MTFRTPIITLEKEKIVRQDGSPLYTIKGISFVDDHGRGHTLYRYTEPNKARTGKEIFELIEKLAHNNNYKLTRVRDFGVNHPRIVVQFVENPGRFFVPYSL